MATPHALVTGATPQAETVAEALRGRDFVVTVAADEAAATAACRELGDRSIQCYVQLPGDVPARGETVVERVRNFLADGLIARFDTARAVLPALAPGAVVLLVSGNHPADTGAPDNHEARLALLDTLAACLLIERSDDRLRPLTLRRDRSPEEIAGLAVNPDAERDAAFAEVDASVGSGDFTKWRDEILSLVHTYS